MACEMALKSGTSQEMVYEIFMSLLWHVGSYCYSTLSLNELIL